MKRIVLIVIMLTVAAGALVLVRVTSRDNTTPLPQQTTATLPESVSANEQAEEQELVIPAPSVIEEEQEDITPVAEVEERTAVLDGLVVEQTDVAYGSNSRQVYDVFYRESYTNAPIIFLVHGGGANGGSKLAMRELVDEYTDIGYVVVAPEYRVIRSEVTSVHDLACSIATVADRAAEYGGDANTLVIHGASFGGYIGSMLAYQPEANWLSDCSSSRTLSFAGFVGHSANHLGTPYDDKSALQFGVDNLAITGPARLLPELASTYNDTKNELRDGAINYIDASDPRALFLYGGKDPEYNPQRVTDFRNALHNVGIQSVFYLEPNAGHAEGHDTPEVDQRIQTFGLTVANMTLP